MRFHPAHGAGGTKVKKDKCRTNTKSLADTARKAKRGLQNNVEPRDATNEQSTYMVWAISTKKDQAKSETFRKLII